MSSGELMRNEVNDIKTAPIENYRNITPENTLTSKELMSAVNAEFSKVANEANNAGLDIKNKVREEQNLDPRHKDCFTTSEERKSMAERSEGDWSGDTGDSKFTPEKKEAKDALKEYDQDGIDYHDGEPDFSKVSETTVEIDDMTSQRYGPGNNFDQADEKCADKWNKEAKDGRTDWKKRDVEKWRDDNRYSWHERLDRKTMDLVPRAIHEECKHYGGVAECKRHESANQ